MYAGDMGGRVWKFDITNNVAVGSLVTGGVLASLGTADTSPAVRADTRRFYYAPDVALFSARGAKPYYNLAIGSGYRGHPLEEDTHDRFYSLRDYAPFTKMTQADYNGRTPITDGDLADITTNLGTVVPAFAPGWRLELRLPGGFQGEKVLAESRTFDNVVFFPTFLPTGGSTGCAPLGGNRVYAVSVDDGRPVIDINRDGQTTVSDRYTDLAQGGIAPEVSFLFLPGQIGEGQGGGGNQGNLGRRPVLCTVGLEVLQNVCRDPGTPVRTYWQNTSKTP